MIKSTYKVNQFRRLWSSEREREKKKRSKKVYTATTMTREQLRCLGDEWVSRREVPSRRLKEWSSIPRHYWRYYTSWTGIFKWRLSTNSFIALFFGCYLSNVFSYLYRNRPSRAAWPAPASKKLVSLQEARAVRPAFAYISFNAEAEWGPGRRERLQARKLSTA